MSPVIIAAPGNTHNTMLKPDAGGERKIHSPYLLTKYSIISSSDFPCFINSLILPLMLFENPASESLTDNPWQVGHLNSFESLWNRSSNLPLSVAKVRTAMPQENVKTEKPVKNCVLINLSFSKRVFNEKN